MRGFAPSGARITLALPALFAGLLASAGAFARTLPDEGGPVRAVRKKSTGPQHLFLVPLTGEAELQIVAFPGGAQVGEQFDILDDQGFVGVATVTKVASQDSGCGGLTLTLATAHLEGTPRPAQGMAAAVGPIERTPTRGRLLNRDEIVNPPPPGAVQTMMLAVDLTGDRTPEMAAYFYDCQQGSSTPPNSSVAGKQCWDVWSREGAEWKRIERVEIPPCF